MRTSACLAIVALLVGACGSSGPDGGDRPLLFLTAPNVPGMSGYLIGSAGPATVYPSTSQTVFVGDASNDTQEFGFYRFDIAAVPPGSEIVEATFRVGQTTIFGGPFGALGGQVVLDHVDLLGSLDPADYVPTLYALNVAPLSTSPIAGERTADVRSAVQADVLAGRTHTDLRLRFPVATNHDGFYDDVAFNNQADAAATGLRPILEIRYR